MVAPARVKTRKSPHSQPWFGTPEEFERIVAVVESTFESRKEKYFGQMNSLAKTPLGPNSDSDGPYIEMRVLERDTQIEGRPSAVLAKMDYRVMERVMLLGVIPYDAVDMEDKLLVWGTPFTGFKIEIESYDEAWVSAAYSKIHAEIDKGTPRWAKMRTLSFRKRLTNIVIASSWIAAVAVYFAVDEVLSGVQSAIVSGLFALALQIGLSVYTFRCPTLEFVRSKDSRVGGLLKAILFGVPSTFFLAIVVNLLTK